jgi:hypothetical protein
MDLDLERFCKKYFFSLFLCLSPFLSQAQKLCLKKLRSLYVFCTASLSLLFCANVDIVKQARSQKKEKKQGKQHLSPLQKTKAKQGGLART